MKRIASVLAVMAFLFVHYTAAAQGEDKGKRPSPPVVATQKIANGATITIAYGQPSVKGRKIGKDLEPMEGKIWRAGANEATVFETDKAVTIEGKSLPAGKYAFFTLKKGATWTLIFNKTSDTWGAYDYEKNKRGDVLKVDVTEKKGPSFSEKLVYTIGKDGKVSMAWGGLMVSFKVVG